MYMRQIAVVTGASSGIGRSVAELLASKGYDLVLLARRIQILEDLVSQLQTRYQSKAIFSYVDLSNPDSISQAIKFVGSHYDHVDVLVNAAGHGKGVGPIWQAEDSDILDQIGTNLTGTILFTKSCLRLMRSGHVFFIGSVFSSRILPNWSIYAATKHALRAFSNILRQELQGIKVTTIHPGSVDTEFSYVASNYKHRNQWPYQPLQPENIAQTILWILDQPSHVDVTEIEIRPTDERQLP